MRAEAIRRIANYLRRTPLHPQWLLGGNEVTGRWVAQVAHGRILDIGCADRWIEQQLPQGSDYIGLDYLATGKHMYGARPDLFADASQLPLADASVDTVVILEVMEHLRRPHEALQEIARVLRPNGRLLLSMPFLYPIHDAPHDYQRLTIHGLTRDINAVGLRVDALTPMQGSAESAGLIACLALGGMSLRAFQQRSPSMLLVPFVIVAIPLVNLIAWLAGRLLPSWDAITAGYQLAATKS
ncbi:class I SAM-dependent methyltransferase [Dokdonella soli]|uniref:Methyltransferase type 11 domain-containing protein n=1 Tax=Dokdonella soli TaxID=529810 RepID=A0ABN1IHV6_9GAMM